MNMIFRSERPAAYRFPAAATMALVLLTLVSVSVFAPASWAGTHGDDPGETVYMRGCVACHGADGAGAMPGVPSLAGEEGPLHKADDALLKSIVEGVVAEDGPLSMPPNGGDDELTEADARLVLDYIRRRFGPTQRSNP